MAPFIFEEMFRVSLPSKKLLPVLTYITDIIRETIYLEGYFGYGMSDSQPEQSDDIIFYLPNEEGNEYLNTITRYLRYIYAPCNVEVTIVTINDVGNIVRPRISRYLNKNVDKRMFNEYIVPLSGANDFANMISLRNDWIDYVVDNGNGAYINHKWQLLFSSHVYKFFVFYKLAESIRRLFSDASKTVEIKTDIINDSVDAFNRDIVVIYTDGEGVCDSPTAGTLTTDDAIQMLRDDVRLNFEFLRIKKVLFRNGDLSRLSASRDVDEATVRSVFTTFAKAEDYNENITPFRNMIRLKSLYNAEIDDEYVVTVRNSYYDDWIPPAGRKQLRGGFVMNWWLIVLVIGVLVILMVLTLAMNEKVSGDGKVSGVINVGECCVDVKRNH